MGLRRMAGQRVAGSKGSGRRVSPARYLGSLRAGGRYRALRGDDRDPYPEPVVLSRMGKGGDLETRGPG